METVVKQGQRIRQLQFKMATANKTPPLKFDKICRACLQIKKDMRPLFEQLTATMLMGISKVQVKYKYLLLRQWNNFGNMLLSFSLLRRKRMTRDDSSSVASRHLCLEFIHRISRFLDAMRVLKIVDTSLSLSDVTGMLKCECDNGSK